MNLKDAIMKETQTETKKDIIKEDSNTGIKETHKENYKQIVKEDTPTNSQQDIFTAPIVNALQLEHNEVFARGRSIDTRVSIVISSSLVVLAAYLQILDWQSLNLIWTQPNFKNIVAILIFSLSLVALIITLIFCMITIFSKRYSSIPIKNYKGFNLKEYEKENITTNIVNVPLIEWYVAVIEHNNKVINNKAKTFRISVIFTIVFVALALTVVLLNKL